jgi:Tfp pilus assembly protein PilO
MTQSMLLAYLRYYQGRLGWIGLGGLLAVIAAVALWFLQLAPARMELEALQARVAANRVAIQTAEVSATTAALTDDERLLAFFNEFPAEEKMPQMLSELFRSAAESGLSLETGEYTLTVIPGSRLKQYRVTLPVKGPLVQILALSSNFLKAVPSAALENASFKREKIDDAQIEAKLVIQFFVKAKP